MKTDVLHSDQKRLPTASLDPTGNSPTVHEVHDANQSDIPLDTHVPMNGLVPQQYLSAKDFHNIGMSMADWARARHFSVPLVYSVVRGERKCLRGQSYLIAKELGMK